MDKIGFLSNGSYPLYVNRQNQRVGVVFPKDTIILDSFLQRPAENCRRRFVLAHEIGHVLINRADPLLALTVTTIASGATVFKNYRNVWI